MKEWYLMSTATAPNMVDGYESDAFIDFKEDAFSDLLNTEMASTVLLYNYDLSQSKLIRAVIQGNTADTYLKSMERSILTSIGVLHSGDYIFYEDEFWIVEGRPGNNKIYEKATLKECQYKLRWQKNNGDIVERWANITSASKYDIGESGNNVITLTTNNFAIVLPNDFDSMTIDGKRVFIDTSTPPHKVFKITRMDDVLYHYGDHGGVLSLIADKTEFDPNIDRPDLGLCDYFKPHKKKPEDFDPEDRPTMIAKIIGDNTIKIGFPREYKVIFWGSSKEEIDPATLNYQWNITSDFSSDLIETNINQNEIQVLIEDQSCLEEKIKIQILVNNIVISERVIAILDTI